MRQETWFDVGLKLWGGLCLAIPIVLWLVNRGRKQADLTISKTESEIYKQLVEKKLSELNISDIIQKRVDDKVNEFKSLLWDASQRHYKEKIELTAELEESYRQNTLLTSRVDELENKGRDLEKLVRELQAKIA